MRHILSIPLVASALMLLAGCGPSNTAETTAKKSAPPAGKAPSAHDPDDVPITEADVKRPTDFADAVTRIASYRDTIRDEIAAGRPSKAHRSLDELDIVLNWLPEIAQESGIAKEQWETINVSAQAVREQFNQVHSNIDAGKDPEYTSHSAAIDEAIEKLSSATGK